MDQLARDYHALREQIASVAHKRQRQIEAAETDEDRDRRRLIFTKFYLSFRGGLAAAPQEPEFALHSCRVIEDAGLYDSDHAGYGHKITDPGERRPAHARRAQMYVRANKFYRLRPPHKRLTKDEARGWFCSDAARINSCWGTIHSVDDIRDAARRVYREKNPDLVADDDPHGVAVAEWTVPLPAPPADSEGVAAAAEPDPEPQYEIQFVRARVNHTSKIGAALRHFETYFRVQRRESTYVFK